MNIVSYEIDWPKTVTVLKDVANIAFFSVVGWITVLTYRKAKRTILQPIRTEVFKQQLEVFSRVLRLFVGKSEFELREEFGVVGTLKANAYLAVDVYRQQVFGKSSDEAQRPYNKVECPGVRVHVDPTKFQITHDGDKLQIVGRETLDWGQYELPGVRIHRLYLEKEKQIQEILESPLLTSALRDLLHDFQKALADSLDTARLIIQEYAREFPQRYPAVDSMVGTDIVVPVWNRFNSRCPSLKPAADKIIDYVREYFDVEKLLET